MQLISFSVSNFKSIKEEATISFVADPRDSSHYRSLNDNEPFGKLLPALALFGANGSGKSNLLSALVFFRKKISGIDIHSVFRSTSKNSIHQNTEIVPMDYWTDIPIFSDNNGSKSDTPTCFRLSFISGVVFDYAISFLKGEIEEEILWRQVSPNEEPEVLFRRKGNEIITSVFSEDDVIPGKKEKYEIKGNYISTRMPVLLANKFCYYPCAIISNYINICLLDYGAVLYNHEWVSKIVSNHRILTNRKINIPTLTAEENLRNMIMLFNYFGCPVTGFFIPTKPGKDEIQFIYKNRTVSLSNESTGNQKLIGIVFMLLRSIRNGGTLVIDEVESGFHEILAFKLIELIKAINEYRFQRNEKLENSSSKRTMNGLVKRKQSRNQVQLLFSTHNTKLLDPNLLRKDQIWFSTKNDDGESEYYSLSDFSDVGIIDDFQKEYLKGDFKAIPISDVNTDTIIQELIDSKVLF